MSKPPNSEFFPHAINPNEWDVIRDYLVSHKIKSVVEFGVGMSTKLFNGVCSRVLSYEHDPAWAKKCGCDVVLFNPKQPIKPLPERFDLAFVDGPNGKYRAPGDCSRYYTTEAGMAYSDIVMVHDASRDGETETIKRLLSDWDREDLVSKRGLSVFRRKS